MTERVLRKIYFNHGTPDDMALCVTLMAFVRKNRITSNRGILHLERLGMQNNTKIYND